MVLTERDRACFGRRDSKPPGSVPWCWQTIDLLKIRWQRKDLTDQQFQEVIDELTAQHVWDVVPPGQPYGSLEALLQAEIGYGEQDARRQLVAQAQPKRGRPEKCDNSSHLTLDDRAQQNGVSRNTQYKLDYLAGHAPVLLTAVQEGQTSIHRAYQEARNLPKPTPLDALDSLRIVTLDAAMDLAAPKGSAPWARAVHVQMEMMLQDATTQLQRFRRSVQVFEAERGYQHLDDAYGHPFPSLRAFCIAKPPHGLGYDPALLEAMVHDTREMTLGEKIAETRALQAKVGAPEGNQNALKNKHDHVRIESEDKSYGNSSAYRIARLKRDHPDIAEALARGEYPSVRAAAKAAGIVRDPTPLESLARAWRQVSPDDQLRFLAERLTPTQWRALIAARAAVIDDVAEHGLESVPGDADEA